MRRMRLLRTHLISIAFCLIACSVGSGQGDPATNETVASSSSEHVPVSPGDENSGQDSAMNSSSEPSDANQQPEDNPEGDGTQVSTTDPTNNGGSGGDPSGGTTGGGPNASGPKIYFQNDWDGNDRDNRNCRRDWEKYNLSRHATALHDPKNPSFPKGSLDLSDGARAVALDLKARDVHICMGGGAGQMLLLLREVAKQGGDTKRVIVVSHSGANEGNVSGAAGQYPPFGPEALAEVKKMIKSFKRIPNQNEYAYGDKSADRVNDVSDFGMIHYVKYGEEKPASRRLFQ